MQNPVFQHVLYFRGRANAGNLYQIADPDRAAWLWNRLFPRVKLTNPLFRLFQFAPQFRPRRVHALRAGGLFLLFAQGVQFREYLIGGGTRVFQYPFRFRLSTAFRVVLRLLHLCAVLPRLARVLFPLTVQALRLRLPLFQRLPFLLQLR